MSLCFGAETLFLASLGVTLFLGSALVLLFLVLLAPTAAFVADRFLVAEEAVLLIRLVSPAAIVALPSTLPLLATLSNSSSLPCSLV